MTNPPALEKLVQEIKDCQICKSHLPFPPTPVVQLHHDARILIAGQAPGLKVQQTLIPFNDPSGDRLREWMGISKHDFYTPEKLAILPMGFCFPGTGKSGDLPPRKECAIEWRRKILEHLPSLELILVIGKYAIDWHIKPEKEKTLTQIVKNFRSYDNNILPLPHPSPRNNIWLKKNPWFEADVLPILKNKVSHALKD